MPVAVIWVFGGNRFWVMGPAILLILAIVPLFLFRFYWTPATSGLVIPPGGWVLLVFLAYLAAILPWANIPYEAWLEIFRYISYAAAYWMWVNLLRFNRRWKWALLSLLFSVSIMAWYALIQEVHGTNMVLHVERPEQYGMRASGAFICPNHFANLLEMMIPVSIALVFHRGAGVAMRLVAGYTALVCLPALYLTESRSGWIGLLAGLIVMSVAVALRKGIRKFLLVLLVAPLIAGGAALAVWQFSPRVQARVTAAIQGDIRIQLWKDSLPIAELSPVIGNGLGSYRWMYQHFRTHYLDYANPEFAHNDYLQFWAEIGAVGLALMAVVVLLVVRRAVRIIRSDPGDSAWLMGGLLGAMAGALAHAFFDFNFHIFGNVHVYVFLLAVLMAATYDRTVDRTLESRGPLARSAAALVGLLAVSLLILYGRSVASYGYTLAAEAQVKKLDWDRADAQYRSAIAWSPSSWKAHLGLAHLLRTRSFWMRNPETRSAWLAESRAQYELAESMNPWEADILYGLGSLCKIEGKLKEALVYRRQTVEKVPRHVFYLNELGLLLREMKRYEEALAVFKESQSIKPDKVSDLNIAWLQHRLAQPR